MRRMSKDEFKKIEDFKKCPFCEGEFSWGYTTKDVPCTLHTYPYCKQFEKLEPHEFLKQVRIRIEN